MQLKQEDYLTERLDDQIDWYSGKSDFNHRMYNRMQVVTIVAAAAIPFLAGYASDNTLYIKIIIGVIGVVVASITAITSLYKYQENWISYRATSEALKQERYKFLTGTDPYHGDDAFSILVQRVEALISHENAQWTHYMNKQQPDAGVGK